MLWIKGLTNDPFSIIIYNVTIKLSRRYTDQQVLEAINLLKNTKISVPEIA